MFGIEGEGENYILNVNEINYAEHIESQNQITIPFLNFEARTVDSYEADVPAEFFREPTFSLSEPSIKRSIVQFFIPCEGGDIHLLEKAPSRLSYSGRNRSFDIQDNCLVIEIIDVYGNGSKIDEEYQAVLREITPYYSELTSQIEKFNSSIKYTVLNYIKQRKEKSHSKNKLLDSLSVPLRNSHRTSTTFSIPAPKLREKITVKPVVHHIGYKPEPTLDDISYQRILKLINDVGQNFERLPSTYKGMEEEHLRDHIIMILDPNFEYGSATGETFNKTGKTDILLRHESSVAFVAECKFWNGEKGFQKAIDQLLGYLTWRNTKTSIVFFVRQKDFTAVLNKIKEEAANHTNYLSYEGNSDENWFNFRFHLVGDKNREIRLAVQLFHLPS